MGLIFFSEYRHFLKEHHYPYFIYYICIYLYKYMVMCMYSNTNLSVLPSPGGLCSLQWSCRPIWAPAVQLQFFRRLWKTPAAWLTGICRRIVVSQTCQSSSMSRHIVRVVVLTVKLPLVNTMPVKTHSFSCVWQICRRSQACRTWIILCRDRVWSACRVFPSSAPSAGFLCPQSWWSSSVVSYHPNA